MTVQEKIGLVHTVRMLGNQITSNFTHTAPRARVEFHPSASLLEHKARKPYTITKQREKWTEEEHLKFLEALKLNGRAWRKIEEHVGTKTTVQIRSHAQKFFSKITREARGFTSDCRDIIEVPPPRPKKKPTHPYPRKFVGGIVPSVIVSSSSSPIALKFEKEKDSSISVLSAADSDTTVSTEFHPKNVHVPSDLSAAGSSATSTVALEVDSKPSTEDDCGTPSHDMVSLCFPSRGKFDEELDSPDNDRNASTEWSSLVSFKLFGSTFEVPHPQKDASIFPENSSLFKKSSTLMPEVSHEKQEKQELHRTLKTQQTMLQADLLHGFSSHSCQESIHDNKDAENSREDFNLLLPLRPLHNPLAGMVSSLYKVSERTPDICEILPQKTVLCKEEMSKVGRKSNEVDDLCASDNKVVLDSDLVELSGYQEKIAVSCWKVSVKSAFSKPMKLGAAQRGFLPYKRCKVEDAHTAQPDKEIRSQTIKFCL